MADPYNRHGGVWHIAAREARLKSENTEEKDAVNSSKGERIFFIIMVLVASVNGGIYMYCKVEKWNLEESMTVFIYPFFAAALSFLFFALGLISWIYFINKLIHTHKMRFILPAFIILFFYLVSNIFFNETKLREYNFKKYQEDREEVIHLILKRELIPDENGRVKLPEWLQDEEMARGGKVYIVGYKSKTGIYFCTFSGLLDSSAGFVYLIDDIFDVDFYDEVTLQNDYGDNWYFCGAG